MGEKLSESAMQKRQSTSEEHKRFKQLIYLKSEIEILNRQLLKLKETAEKDKQFIAELPDAAHITSQYTNEIAALTESIGALLRRCVIEHKYLMDYILSISDSFVRQIFILRFVEGLSYEQAAKAIGGPNSPGGLEIAVRRQIRGHR